MKAIIFTDIDGTLIDFETYSYAEVAPAVSRLVARQIPIVLCSSKTRTEQAYYRQALRIPDPFIVENGSAIMLPPGYFDADLPPVIELGVTAVIIRQALDHIRQQTGLDFQGYHDLALPEICRITGLDETAAARARQREYSETIVTPLTTAAYQHLHTALAAYGLTIVSGGKFHTVMSAKSNKGTAVTHLAALFQQQWGDIVTIGLGDSANDAPLLAAVERPFLVQKPGGRWQDMGDLPLTKVAAVGPLGWRQVAEAL
ncbi:MAG: HAD-IIB family hydrolase [Chloroflexota bacterium]|jgi:mannosyl-3-phosphoglycerate phosphatase